MGATQDGDVVDTIRVSIQPPHGGRPCCQVLLEPRGVSIHAPAWGRRSRWEHPGRGILFQSRPRMGATSTRSDIQGFWGFNPRPPWGATPVKTSWILTFSFQSRPRMGGDQVLSGLARLGVFQSTPPLGATRRNWLLSGIGYGFNPRPRMGGDLPAGLFFCFGKGFNPRPRMGGDSLPTVYLWIFLSFNPRPRMGGDQVLSGLARPRRVSIHAPAWGATYSVDSSGSIVPFQSTPPHGGRRWSFTIR